MSTEENKNVSTDISVNAASEITTSRISQTMMDIAIVWFAVVAALGFSGFFLVYSRILSLIVVTPLIIFWVVFAFSPQIRVWAFALDPRLIVLLNMLRAGGLAFLMLYADGRLSGAFALPAGWMDFPRVAQRDAHSAEAASLARSMLALFSGKETEIPLLSKTDEQ
jgi:hypothetical protein